MMMRTMSPVVKNEIKNRAVETRKVSLMTPIGLIEGDILRHLENRALTVVQDLIQDLEWPAHMVLMAAGSLIRQGYVRAFQNEAALVLEPVVETDIERRGAD